jgi:hypothetical protein
MQFFLEAEHDEHGVRQTSRTKSRDDMVVSKRKEQAWIVSSRLPLCYRRKQHFLLCQVLTELQSGLREIYQR